MADVKKQVAHALFRYSDGEHERFAMYDEVIELSAAEAKRGEELGALRDPDPEPEAEAPAPEKEPLGDFPTAGDDLDAAQEAWLAKANMNEVTTFVSEHPDTAEAVMAAEQRRGDKARKTLLEALAKQQQQ